MDEIVIRFFGMTGQMVSHDLSRIEREFKIEIGHLQGQPDEKDETYYPQFAQAVRDEASFMARHYEIFYCLEKSIRSQISQLMESAEGPNWWSKKRIPQKVHQDVADRIQKEVDSGTTRRSDDQIDYTTFGELGEIIKANWDIFGSVFNSQKAVEKVMSNLNTLRGPIAHCSLLAEDEVLRLRLSVRDWFRLME